MPNPDAIELDHLQLRRCKSQSRARHPYIPSGSFAKAIVIEGRHQCGGHRASKIPPPCSCGLIGHVQMPNDHEYDLTGCFVTLEAWGDVSSERPSSALAASTVRKMAMSSTRRLPAMFSSGQNGIKGEAVMRNGEILGWAWGAGFVDVSARGSSKQGTPGGRRRRQHRHRAAATFQVRGRRRRRRGRQDADEYYIKRAEQYHPIIPIGAGNEVTMIFQGWLSARKPSRRPD